MHRGDWGGTLGGEGRRGGQDGDGRDGPDYDTRFCVKDGPPVSRAGELGEWTWRVFYHNLHESYFTTGGKKFWKIVT